MVGTCHQELTNSSSCPEGFQSNDALDFYKLQRTGTRGCTDERASNFDAAATEDDGSCEGADPCASRTADGKCANCVLSNGCTSGNEGYRNAEFDRLYAPRVADGAITVDGNLRDWSFHTPEHCYSDVAFANATGDIVVFEAFGGGVWYGPSDFGINFMLSWDTHNLYLAAEVSDDVLQVGETCYANGLQAAFEVGGPKSAMPGMLQAERSKSLDYSRMQLLNVGLSPGQEGPTGAACSSELADPMGCCMHFELDQHAGGFAKSTRAAVLRNPISKVTVFEVAYGLGDLVGSSEDNAARWGEGLTFGFSFLVNDGDESTAQQGWAGYYPHALVHGWNGGQKQPWKVGTLELVGYDNPPCGGGCTGWIFFGTFILAPLLAAAAYGGHRYYLQRTGGGGARSTANPLAGADHMGNAQPALTVIAPPMSSTA